MTTQDFLKLIDLSAAAVPITGTQINQLLETARPATDKGLVITSTDTGVTPDVPDPDTAIIGVMPTWWKKYIWRRQMADEVRLYVWDETAPSDATYLQWVQLDVQGATALATATTALAQSATAQTDAATAVATANSAEAQAQAAQADVNALENTVAAVDTRVDAIEEDPARYLTGDIRVSAGTFTYSTTEDQGWLAMDGSSVSVTTFARLFAVIGNTYGGSGGVFSVPDMRGRGPLGSGTGSGLTARALAEKGGAERVTLTAGESGLPAHKHQISVEASVDAPAAVATKRFNAPDGNFEWVNSAASAVGETRDVAAAAAANSHENMAPFLVLNYYIKT